MAPEDIRCSPLTSTSLQVSWQPPPEVHQNGIVQGYKINYEPFNDLSGNIILSSTTAF
jgi:Down syndrome cell adhesion molecule